MGANPGMVGYELELGDVEFLSEFLFGSHLSISPDDFPV
jgi:hypothetical protein